MTRILIRLLAALLAFVAAFLLLSGAKNLAHAQAPAAPATPAAAVTAGSDADVSYWISGPASGCDPAGTNEGEMVSFHLDAKGVFHADFGAGHIAAFSDLASMKGTLREDGSFTLETDWGRSDSTWQGKFDSVGNVTGSWVVTNPDTKCTMSVGPLSSELYFGIATIDWHTAFGAH